ncbi:hypothetical protein ACVWZR_005604 [Bradyrhizobium sp. i1.3.1]
MASEAAIIPVDAAAGRVVDERIDAVPEGIADMNDVGFCKSDGDVAIGMRGPVIFQVDRASIEPELVVAGKDFTGDSARAERKEIVVPVLYALNFEEVLSRVLLRDDPGASGMEPFVAIGVIEMPVGVDEMGDGIGAEIGHRFGELGTRDADAGID